MKSQSWTQGWLFFLLVSLSLQASAAQTQPYRAWFDYGLKLESAGDFSGAAKAFDRSMRSAKDPSLQARIALKCARSYTKTAERSRALAYYDFYLREFPIDPGVAAEREAASKPPVAPAVSWTSTLWRSALLPGWGQWHRGDRIWPFILAGAEAWFLYSWNSSRAQAEKSYAAYKVAVDARSAEQAHNDTTANDNAADTFIVLSASLYGFNLVDASLGTVLLTPRSKEATAWDPMLPGPAPAGAPGLALAWRF